jgi:hypothetical protein
LQDDVVAREIANKLGQAPGISYTDIANRAIDAHRNQLALKVAANITFCIFLTLSVKFSADGL